MKFMLRLGATPYRCAPCRCNFASFRPCKERYSWRKKKAEQEAAARAAEAAEQQITHESVERQ